MWTEVAPIRRGQGHSEDVLPTAEKLAVPTTNRIRVNISGPQPGGNELEASAL